MVILFISHRQRREFRAVNRDFASSLIQLNNTFYREHSASFSDTRQAPWPGWVRTMDIALEQLDVATIEHPVRVFDLACGNMRFENFAAGGALAAKGVDGANPSADASCPFEFYGVDSCQDLAIDAHGHALRIPNLHFQELDVLDALMKLNPAETPDVLFDAPLADISVCFGFMHHVPSCEYRVRVLDALVRQTRPGGIIAISFWEFMNDERMARKAENLKHDYAATQKRDEFRLRGDLITANLYRMKSGEKVLHAENYYEDGCPTIDIPLDPLLSPQQNAAKNYKQYNKLKTAEFHLREQIEKAENERAYLESVLQELSQAETEQEFNEIRRELQETNYIRKSSGKKELKRAFAPRTFKTSSGLEVLVGRSNVQNDQLTKKADKRDYWFHTQHIHGSHVILRCAGLTPSDDDLREAAMLASYFSQAKESSSVPVDYCPVKFVKKPAGARPGMVTYDNYRTLYVTPEEGLAKKLFIR